MLGDFEFGNLQSHPPSALRLTGVNADKTDADTRECLKDQRRGYVQRIKGLHPRNFNNLRGSIEHPLINFNQFPAITVCAHLAEDISEVTF